MQRSWPQQSIVSNHFVRYNLPRQKPQKGCIKRRQTMWTLAFTKIIRVKPIREKLLPTNGYNNRLPRTRTHYVEISKFIQFYTYLLNIKTILVNRHQSVYIGRNHLVNRYKIRQKKCNFLMYELGPNYVVRGYKPFLSLI